VLMFLLLFFSKKQTISPSAIHPIALGMGILLLLNATLHLYITGEAWQTTGIILLIIGCGFFFLATNYFISFIILGVCCWLAVAWNYLNSPAWMYYGLWLTITVIMSIMIHIVRVKTIEHTERLRLRDEFHHQKLEQTLTDLNNQESLYCDLLENANDLIQSVDQDGRFLYVNRRWKEVMGYDDEDLKEINFRQIIAAEHLAKCEDVFQRIIRGESAQTIETVFVTKERRHIFVEGNINGQFRDGQFIATRGTFRNITLRKKAEEALKQERILLRTVIDNIPDAIYAKDLAMRKILVNQADLSNIGKSEAEVIGKTDQESFPTEVANRFLADDQAVLVNGETITNHEELLINDAGQNMWLLTSKLPLRDLEGNIIGLVGISRNITELKHANEKMQNMHAQLQDLNKKLALAYEEARNQKDNLLGIVHEEQIAFLLDAKGLILGVTEKAIQAVGFSRLELIGKNLTDLIEPEMRLEIGNQLKAGIIGTFKQLNINFIRSDGKSMEYNVGLNRLSMERDRWIVAILREV